MIHALRLGVLCALFLSGIATIARAIEELEVEENISDLLPDPFPGSERTSGFAGRKWAVLPEFGYNPDTGVLAGAKLSNRDVFGVNADLDLEGVYSINEKQFFNFSFAFPHLFENRGLVLVRAKYDLDPQRYFFGLGNNDVGPEPVSTHEIQEEGGSITLGWRPFERLALNFAVGLRKVHIRDGDRKDDCNGLIPCPFTPQAFPDLDGIDGGVINPWAVSLVWNNRDDVMRPTRGLRAILKIVNANQAFSDFKFTRFFVDLGYLRSFFGGRVIAGARLNGEFNESANDDIPFWELAELGGRDTLRGFFPYRFLGTSRVLLNTELRGKLTEFDFFDIWRVRLDGVVFGDVGRVFASDEELRQEFSVDDELLERIVDNFQFSYGCGVRIVLSEALVARIDAGFSDEEIGLLYLSFGHTF